MAILDIVMQMRNQGRPDSEIISSLQEKGVSPKEIQDALSQAQIKGAVNDFQGAENMQASIMENPPQEAQALETTGPQAPIYSPQTQEALDYQDYPQNPYPQENYNQEQYPEYYGNEYASYSQGTSDTGTLMEIAEQVFAEKIKKIQTALENLTEFKSLTNSKIKLFEERIKRLETTIDQLQISILEKIGSYGKNLESVKKEMSMIQDSFGKVVDTVLDKKTKRKGV